MNKTRKVPSILLTILLICSISLLGCTSGGGGDDESSSGDDDDDDSSGEVNIVTLECPIVKDGVATSSVDLSSGTFVRVVRVLSPNRAIVADAFDPLAGEVLFKLQGVSDEGIGTEAATGNLSGLISAGAYMFPASTACESVPLGDGGVGVLGGLVTPAGENVAVEMLKPGLVEPSGSDSCGGDLISACLASEFESELQTLGELGDFLWKPISDSNGRLAVHTGPFNTVVIVSGETGANQGPGNGFGSLARFSKPGGAYGANVVVNVRDEDSGLAYTLNGSTDIIIPNGSQRYCANAGGPIFACTK